MTSLCFVVESGTDVRLVEGLARRFALTVIARRIEGGVEISRTPAVTVPVEVGPASRIKFALFVWRHLLAHRKHIDRVIVQGYGPAALAANLAGRWQRTRTAMLICSPVEAYYRCRKSNPFADKPFRRRELFMLLALARINAALGRQYIVLSEYLADVIRRQGTSAPVAVIPVYGVDTELFKPAVEAKAELKAKLNLPTTGSLIVFSSRMAPEKDSETLLAAFSTLLTQGRDVWLLHRSGGYQRFLNEAERLGIRARVIATEAVHPQRQLPLDYQASDLCIQASRAEGLGFSPLEALACHVPVIATAVGGLQETIIAGQTGWTYPAGNAEALVRCIEAALDDPDEALRRAVAGRQLVVAKYDQEIVFEKLERLITGV